MKPTGWPRGIPYIDPMVRHTGVSELRKLTADVLRGLKETIVLQDESGAPLAILVPWEDFMAMQRHALEQALARIPEAAK